MSEFFRACRGLILFGVPNLGLRHEQLTSLVHGKPNQQLIHDLEVDRDTEPSPYLQDLAQAFTTLHRRAPKLNIITYYERRLSPTVQVRLRVPNLTLSITINTIKQQQDGSWTRTGPPCLMVTGESAGRVGSEDNFYYHYPIDSDHSGLVKFDDAEDSAYRSVRMHIKQWITYEMSELSKEEQSIKPI